ncbi:MAG: cytochrome [Gammaproteobacteria bacterium]|nr:cytochrome [Gammaproteobacteria bacterium]
MKPTATLAAAAIGTLAFGAIAAGVFLESGLYDIGADDHHTKITLALIEHLRERSIEVRAQTIAVPALEDPARVAAGAERYAALCVGCHLAPGVVKSDLRSGLYPRPPNLAQEETRDARRAFWTIKHGIKMSAMPAWGKSLDDGAIWDVVAFVRQMPAMTSETYRQLSPAR